MLTDKLKEAGVSIHVIATGAGAGTQQVLWSTPGCSAYMSGASFPYSVEETEDMLGFKVEQSVCEDTAIDLASAAYMKAYRFGGNKPVGVGITASVASERMHRGDHRADICIITDSVVKTYHRVLDKGAGQDQRWLDGILCNDAACNMIDVVVGHKPTNYSYNDATDKATARFLMRPFFTADDKRHNTLPNTKQYALMPGAFNPPHEGHFGVAEAYLRAYGRNVVYEVGANPPHKPALSVQELLKRSKLLQGRDRFFSMDMPLYLDKAKAYPQMPLLIGADALLRMFDPKWGIDTEELLKSFKALKTKFAVSGREIDGKFVGGWKAVATLPDSLYRMYADMFVEMPGRWDISSTELRNKKK